MRIKLSVIVNTTLKNVSLFQFMHFLLLTSDHLVWAELLSLLKIVFFFCYFKCRELAASHQSINLIYDNRNNISLKGGL